MKKIIYTGKYSSVTLIMFIITIQAFYLSCTNPDTGDPGRKSRFDFEGRSTFILINDTEDSLHIHLSNWYTLPFRLKEFDTLVAPRTRTEFLLVSQNNTYNNLTLSGKKFKIFSIPGSVDSMIVLKEIPPVDVSFSGDLKTINEFLLKKKTKFKSVDADWMPRINATSSAKNLSELITVNDSITKLHIEFLKENAKLVPEWYLHFEKERLKYLNAGVKLNSLNYRKDMLNIKDSVPENFLQTTVGSLPISNEAMFGNMRYMYFLNDYMNLKMNRKQKGSLTKVDFKTHASGIIELMNTELSEEVRDMYLPYYLSKIIDHKRHDFDEKWLELVENDKLRLFLLDEFNSKPILPLGSALPYFYLPDTSNNYVDSDKYKGQILLINFWATWCKPCIEDFPYENHIVEKFSGEPVKVLNIGIESNEESWKNMVKKHGLKSDNVLAQGSWNDKLNKEFDINALPHSTLVDWNGRVVQNKCPRASENVDELISKLLIKMKLE